MFLRTRKHNLKREGLMYLYRTQVGVKAIEYASKKYSKILKPLQYLVVISGFILMISMIYLLFTTLLIYLQQPEDSAISKVPAIFPLIPYFPQLFNLDSIFPPFYFTYFLISIAVIAISHEFAHGIFARLNNVKIHSTGFAFLGPFLGAFVEQDDKQMNKTSKFAQLSILAAGTFANVLMFILFGILLLLFFAMAFAPTGVIFTSYATTTVNISDTSISGQPISLLDLNDSDLVKIESNNLSYYTNSRAISYSLQNNLSQLFVYEDSPAFNANLSGAIIEVDYTKTTSYQELGEALARHNPGDTINIKTINDSKDIKEYEITLSERNGKSYLGIATAINTPKKSFAGAIFFLFTKFKDPNIFYMSKIGDMGIFIYDLLWWVVIINILVALFNMYPAGILDGGRFLMLTVWGITGNKRWGENILKVMTWLLLAFVTVMMVKWVFNIF